LKAILHSHVKRPRNVAVNVSKYVSYIRQWNYFRSTPTYVITVPELYRQTDRQTDDNAILPHNRATSRGKTQKHEPGIG